MSKEFLTIGEVFTIFLDHYGKRASWTHQTLVPLEYIERNTVIYPPEYWLDETLIWDATVEGGAYWSKLNNNWRKLCNKFNLI